ncbi:MAG TPA: glutathione S-transferase N-terminal domain-containing protein [Candidatus Binatia bacterium]|nr:glutathione S-transferase N-terminal domain-containing protein [Candidatus Binatia bacterium]
MKGKPVKPVPTAAVTRAGMTVYCYGEDLASHWVRIVVAEKDIDGLHLEYLKPGVPAEDLLALDALHAVPTLADREVVLNTPRIIVEYLDERYPHPPLMPVEPSARARLRLALHRVEQDLVPLVAQIKAGPAAVAQKSRKQLCESLVAGINLFTLRNYFLSGDFSCVDALWAALLWRLPSLGVELGAAGKPLQRYSERLFGRAAFLHSLTPAERALR